MRRARPTLCLLASAAVFSVVGANAGVVTTGFDNGAEGWEAAGDGAGNAQWLAVDDQPAGHLAISDAALGWAYFAAPAVYRMPIEEGALLSFDLKSNSDAAHPIVSPVRVALVGAGLTLVAETVLPTASTAPFSGRRHRAASIPTMQLKGEPMKTPARTARAIARDAPAMAEPHCVHAHDRFYRNPLCPTLPLRQSEMAELASPGLRRNMPYHAD